MSRQRPSQNETEAALKTPRFAVVALSVAGLSVLCPPLGAVAVVLGLLARRRCRDSLRGEPVAMSAIALGAMTSVAAVSFLIVLLDRAPVTHTVRVAQTQSVLMPKRPVFAHTPRLLDDPSAPLDSPLRTSHVGKLLVVDIGPAVRSLSETLDEQRARAADAREHVLLWTVVPDCAPCTRVAAAFEAPRLQSALAGVRLLRLNAADFVVELTHLNVPTDAFPGFSILGPDGRAVDHVHGGEWDDDIADNIAPVLESFVHGTYTERRDPWRGGPREDETAI